MYDSLQISLPFTHMQTHTHTLSLSCNGNVSHLFVNVIQRQRWQWRLWTTGTLAATRSKCNGTLEAKLLAHTPWIAISPATAMKDNYKYKERCMQPAVVWQCSRLYSWRSHPHFARFKPLLSWWIHCCICKYTCTRLQLLSGEACGPVQSLNWATLSHKIICNTVC